MILKKSLLFVGAILFLVNLFIISFWLNLSPEKLSGWLEFQLNKIADRQYQIRLTDAETKIWGLSIGELIVTRQQDHKELLNLQNIEVRIDPYTVIRNKGGVQVDADVYLGEVKSVITYYPERKIEYVFSEIQFNRNSYLRKLDFIRSNPQMSGAGATILSHDLKPEMSELKLNVNQLLVSGNSKTYSLPLTLPDADFKSISADLKYKNNILDFEIQLVGDISARIKGNIVRNTKKLKKSKIDIKIDAEFSVNYKKKLGFVQTILKSYSTDSGKISIRLQGSIGAPIINKI